MDMTIDAGRLWSRLMTLAGIGATGTTGEVNRQALSDEDIAATRLVIRWAEEAGMRAAFDRAGNLFLTLAGEDRSLPPVLAGSHLDSQPTGGRFDGALGVMAALEAATVLAGQGGRKRDLVVVAWSNEEGSRFAPGMTGSEVFAGRRNLEAIRALKDADGVTLGEAVDRYLAAFADQPLREAGRPGPIAAYLELHIEQASVLERQEKIIGAVTGIQGKVTWEITLSGAEAHAGTEPMARRRDALQAFTRVAGELYRELPSLSEELMFTIGRLEVAPNAPSVVPARARFRVDLRHADGALMARAADRLEEIVAARAAPCGLDIKRLSEAAPNDFSPELRAAILAAAAGRGFPACELISYAGHDARHLARVTDRAAMIFVPCRDGLSHHPDEWTEPDHAAAGTQVLLDVLARLLHD